MKFTDYPLITEVVAADTLLVAKDSNGAVKQIAAGDLADSLDTFVSQTSVVNLPLIDVTSLSSGARQDTFGYTTVGDGGGGTFYYNSASTAADNGGTVIKPAAGPGRWLRPSTKTLNVKAFGAKGDGATNDTTAIQNAVNTAAAMGVASVYFPAGVYKITSQISLASTNQVSISFTGDGANVSIIKQFTAGANGLNLAFSNVGADQPFWASISNLGFECSGVAGTGIIVSFGDPASTINHKNPALIINKVMVKSTTDADSWANGIDITSAWNCHLTDVFVSGSSQGGVWANLSGDGIAMHGLCVNSHFSNCQVSFFLNGFHWSKGSLITGVYTEGLFFSNCSFTQNRRGVYVQGDAAIRVSTVNWQGGLIETRGGIAGIHLLNVHDFRVVGTMIIPEVGGVITGVLCDTCQYGEIGLNEFYACLVGVSTTGTCKNINVSNCVNRGTTTQVAFGASTTNSTSGGHNCDTDPLETNAGGATNRIYVGKSYGVMALQNVDQTIPDGVETNVDWNETTAGGRPGYDDLPLTPAWVVGQPDRITIPAGINYVKLHVGIRWDPANPNLVPSRVAVRIKSDPGNIVWAADVKAAGSNNTLVNGDVTVSTPKIKCTGINYFFVTVQQTSGSALDLRGANAYNFIAAEYLG